MNKEQVVYLVGIAVLGIAYPVIKESIQNGIALVSIAVAYLLLLRWIAKKL